MTFVGEEGDAGSPRIGPPARVLMGASSHQLGRLPVSEIDSES